MIQVDGQTKVKDWYGEKFPQDDWGFNTMNPGITFQDVFEGLQIGMNIYALLGAGDSIVRERVFDELAALMDVSYDVVYYQWLNHGKKPLGDVLWHDMSKLRFKND